MPHITSFQEVKAFGDFLLDSSYEQSGLTQLGLGHSLHTNLDNLDALIERTTPDARLPTLARLFFVGQPLPESVCRDQLPASVVDTCLATGVLCQHGDQLKPGCLFLPFREINVACDTVEFRRRTPNFVTGPSATTNTLPQLLVTDPSHTTLDLGTGSGVLGIRAAKYSGTVIGTDISDRAIEFARFSAALAGATNFSAVVGDAFDPVPHKRFTRIIANPPFFITPVTTFVYSDSPLELDGFCRRIVKEAPDHLEENGFFQMVGEWVELEGQKWQERLQEWLDGSGCDTLILCGRESDIRDYVERRMAESDAHDYVEHHADAVIINNGGGKHSLSERIAYFKKRHVTKVVSGVIIMRKRSGTNWVSLAPFNGAPNDMGRIVVERFNTLDFLGTHSGDQLIACRFGLSDGLTLDQNG
jgi:methylase of polypeptide subunit release factors